MSQQGGGKGPPKTERSTSWSTAGSGARFLTISAAGRGELDVDGIMEDIREENPDAATIDPDTFQSIIQSNAL